MNKLVFRPSNDLCYTITFDGFNFEIVTERADFAPFKFVYDNDERAATLYTDDKEHHAKF